MEYHIYPFRTSAPIAGGLQPEPPACLASACMRLADKAPFLHFVAPHEAPAPASAMPLSSADGPAGDPPPAAEAADFAHLVLQHTTELIALIDHTGHYRFVTPAYQRLGYTAAEIVGLPIADVIHPDDLAQFAGATDITITLRMRNSTGDWQKFAGELRAVEHAGKAMRMLIMRDAAPLYECETAQRTLVIDALATEMIHDLNNMLTIIAGNADIVAEHLPANHPAHPDLALISAVAAHAGSVTNQVATYVANQHNERRHIALGAWLRETRPLIHRLAGPLVQVDLAGAPDLWPINANPSELTEVLLSLVAGARAAMPTGGRITLRIYNAPAALGALAVVGDAVVIELNASARSGNLQARLEHSEHELNLACCRRIIEAHGGTLQGADAVGHGTTWRIVLPHAGTD